MPTYDYSVYREIKSRLTAGEYAERHLEKRAHNTYVCPCCDSGNGPNGTAAMHVQSAGGEKWHCYSCNAGGDVFDLVAAHLGIDPSQRQLILEETARAAGVDLEPYRSGQDNGYKRRDALTPKAAVKREPAKPADYTAERKKQRRNLAFWRTKLEDPAAVGYLESRGISLEKAREWGLGYNQGTRRVIVPWKGCDWGHIDRDVTGEQPAKYLKPSREKVGEMPLYNREALGSSDVVFVVEGPFDALAVQDLGFEAVALNMSGSAQAADKVARENPSAKIVLMLDNDAARDDGRNPGMEGATAMAGRLKELGIVGCVCNAMARLGVKDPFEAWQSNREGLAAELEKAAGRMRSAESLIRQAQREQRHAEHAVERGSLPKPAAGQGRAATPNSDRTVAERSEQAQRSKAAAAKTAVP